MAIDLSAPDIESLACLRGTGMSVQDMRTYVQNMTRGPGAAAQQQQLFDAHARRLADEIERLHLRRRYVAAKADMRAARLRDDSATEEQLIPAIIALGNRLLEDEATRHD